MEEDETPEDDRLVAETLDPVEAELRSMIAEQRMDAILAGLPSGDGSISAGGISLAWWGETDEDEAGTGQPGSVC